MHLHPCLGCICYCAGEVLQSVALPPQLLAKTQLQIGVSMAFQENSWDLTLLRQFWQCTSTYTLYILTLVLEESNNLWHCLPNWCPKHSFKLISAWPFRQIAKISQCSDSFDNAFAPAHRVFPSLCCRRATICGIASSVGARNSASNWSAWSCKQIAHISQ